MADDALPLILIVAGTTLAAERRDRALAYRLREAVLRALDERAQPAEATVVADTLYLRDDALREAPSIAVGPPEDNAAAAFAEGRTPIGIEAMGAMTVRVDLDLVQPLASCWGSTDANTARACDAFVERYLGMWLDRWIGRAGRG